MPHPHATGSQSGPVVSAESVRLHIPIHVADLDGVQLELDWPLDVDHAFVPDGAGGWELELRRPRVHRFEYKLKIRSSGRQTVQLDPTNPLQVPGPFGAKSEIRFPDYREPGWLATAVDGVAVEVDDEPSRLEVPVPIRLFSPTALPPNEPAPLLLAHDGSDLADRGSLLCWASASERPLRVALLDPPPGYRNAWYAASLDYADHIGKAVLPTLKQLVPVSSVIGMGISLGAVAIMTIHRRHPEALDGLVLQSGSFFRPELDPQESGWPEFHQVTEAVAQMTGAAPHQVRRLPVLLTVGAVEENRANNERMAGALAFQGYDLDARIVPDAHNMIGWRDAWSPGLDQLLAKF
jgi:enterochelin esterase-like enzyme